MATRAAPIPSARQRVIRAFVSSTFRDMQAERDELAKRIFPQLRKLCESRGVTWGQVDLRWGINDEQKAEGKVLPICLAEIRNCRPYFIGLLGERYGWVPDEVPPTLIAQESWLAELRGHSVTELEILHGVLNNPQMAEHAFFYFRDSAYVQSVPEKDRKDFTSENPEEAEKLRNLKEQIRKSGLPVRGGYRNPRVLGRTVRRDLTRVINKLFPQGSQPDPLEREAAEHEIFARSRCVVEVRPGEKVGVYIGRREYTDQLDAHAAGDGPPLVVLGESGLGKSALLANWAMRYRAAHAGELLLMHFIGATPASADWAAMVRRILGEFNRRFELKIEIPDKPDALRATFANALYMAATKGRVILILGALNQLEDRDQAPDLVWLPPVLPPDVRLIVSTLLGRPLDDLKKRGWPTLQVEPLKPEERRQLAVEYLAQYVHSLSPALLQRIALAPQTANPLYLRALLEELLLWGEHQTLGERIAHYLSAPTVSDLYQKILERYEEDYERERPGLVRDAMSLLWAARRGLSEAELMDLLRADGQPLPRAHWSPLHLAAEASLVNRSGLIGFFHDYFRQAVRERYLAVESQRQGAHLRLAGYFETRELGDRKVDELPWQLAEAHAWPQLYELLAEAAFFDAAWEASEFEVKTYWACVEASSSLRMVNAYRQASQSPQRFQHLWNMATLLRHTGHTREAFSLYEYLASHLRQIGDISRLSGVLGTQGTILHDQGELGQARILLQKAEVLCREAHDDRGAAVSLSNQALILMDGGHLDAAMELFKTNEAFYRALGDRDALQLCLHFQARILFARGETRAADDLYSEQERICRETGNKDGLQACMGARAMLLRDCGQTEQAVLLLREKEQICRQLGNRDGVSVALGNQALFLKDCGKLDEAMALHKQEEQLCRELGSKTGLAICLGNQAVIMRLQGDPGGALRLHKEEERLCRETGTIDGVQRSLGNQAVILLDRHDYPAAMALIQQQEGLCRETGSKISLVDCLTLKAAVLRERGEFNALSPVMQELERLVRQVSTQTVAGLGTGLAPAKAKGLLQMFERIRNRTVLREASDLPDSETDPHYWERRGLAMISIGSNEEAAKYFAQGLALEPDSLSLLHNKGTALLEAGRLEAALACFDRCLELEPDSALAWNNRGTVMGMAGRYQEALAAFNRALECDSSCVTAQVGRRRALSMLARSAQTIATNNQPRAMREEVPGGQMKTESGSATCPRCGSQLSTEDDVLRHWKELGVDGIRARCPNCGTMLILDFKTNKVELEG